MSKTTVAVPGGVFAPLLVRVAGIIENRTTIPILSTCKIAWAEGAFSVTSSNLDSFLSETLELRTADAWTGCVNATALRTFVRSLSGTDVVSIAADADMLTVSANGATARFNVSDARDFPVAPLLADEAVSTTLSAETLLAALRFVRPAVSDEETRYYLCGVFLDPGEVAVTTDGHRLGCHAVAGLAVPEPGIIVPTATVDTLLALLRGDAGEVTFTSTENLITVIGGRWSLTSKLIDGRFPDWRRVVPPFVDNPVVVEHARLKAAVQRVADMATDKTHEVQLALAAGALAVSGRGLDAAVRTTVPAAAGPPEARWAMNARYLLGALNVVEGNEIELHVHDEETPMWCRAVGDSDAAAFIVTPIRVNAGDWHG